MSIFIIKIIACITMLIDHAAYCFLDGASTEYYIGRAIGRTALVLFCFSIVEGYLHTRSVKRYMFNLALLGLLAEFPFDYMTGRLSADRFLTGQNVCFTLLLGLLAITLIDILKSKYMLTSPTLYNLLGSAVIILLAFTAFFIRSDSGIMGVLCVIMFYFCRGNRVALVCGLFIWVFLSYQFNMQMEEYALAALIPILMYNGTKGRTAKLLFYCVYPLHMLAFALIREIL